MRQIVNKADGGYEVLAVEEVEDPSPDEDELIVEVRASGLNFADILARKGQYPDAPAKPCVMGYEIAGVVVEAGAPLEREWLGREVVAMTRFGGQAGKVRVKSWQLFDKPGTLSFEEAAAIPVNYLTAWVLIRVMGGLQPEESILIQNVGGGVGLAALDIAKRVGATVFGTASAHKHDFLYERGIDFVIDYRRKEWYPELMNLTDNRGVELVIDSLGGREWKKSYKALRSTGRLGMFGISTASSGTEGGIRSKWNLLKTVARMPIFHPLSMIGNNRGVFGVNLGHLWHEREKARIWIENILQGVEEEWIRPHVDKKFSFDRVDQAHRHLEERKNIGKVILVP